MFLSVLDPLLDQLNATREELAATQKTNREGEINQVILFICRKGKADTQGVPMKIELFISALFPHSRAQFRQTLRHMTVPWSQSNL